MKDYTVNAIKSLIAVIILSILLMLIFGTLEEPICLC